MRLHILCLLIPFCFFAGVSAEFRPSFGQYPRLAITANELAKNKASPDFKSRRDAAVRAGEALLQNPTYVPTEWGNWVFYYANPKTGGRLVAISHTEHRDP
ncbi:MAG: hypothetical protein QF886_20295, partial [Planctomycetota bacterium]|nr:hypothetical protein [Planctomycetota bacterium]